MENNNILILGGAGFIGSQLASFLIKKKKKISIIDGLVGYTGGSLKNLENIQNHLSYLKLFKIESNLNFKNLIEQADIIIDCMGLTNHNLGISKPLLDIKINLNSHVSFLKKFGYLLGNKTIFNLSSVGVYGIQSNKFVYEYNECKPMDPQSFNKFSSELYYNYYATKNKFIVLNLRIPSCFGPTQNLKQDSGFFSFLVNNILKNKKFVIFDSLSRSRHLLYLDDLNFIIYKLMKIPFKQSSLFNIVGDKISIEDIFKNFKKLNYQLHYDVLEKKNLGTNFIDQFDYTISNQKLLDYVPKFKYTNFEKSLIDSIKYIKLKGTHNYD